MGCSGRPGRSLLRASLALSLLVSACAPFYNRNENRTRRVATPAEGQRESESDAQESVADASEASAADEPPPGAGEVSVPLPIVPPRRVASKMPRADDQLPVPRKVEKVEPLTLHLDDVEVRKALEILSREGKLSIMVAPGVAGRVTINLKDVAPEQALDAVTRLAGLVVRREQGVVFVYSPEELSQALGRDPRLAVRVYHLNYVRAADIEKMLRPLLSPTGKLTTSPPSEVGIGSSIQQGTAGQPPPGGGGTGEATPGAAGGAGGAGGGLSSGGNSLAGGEVIVVQDQQGIVEEIDRIIAQLDVQPLQVLIEAVIMRVTLNKGQELGVNFGVVDAARLALAVSGNGATINAATAFKPLRVLTAEGFVRGDPGRGFAADEPGLKFGFVDRDVTAFIRALERIGKVEVLATPRVLVLNKQRAQLQLGQRLGFATFSQSQVSTVQQVQFLNVGTQLRVRPFISSDGMIRMEVNPERSTGQVVNNIPQTDTAELTTNVMVPDGSTLVIGGLIETVKDRRQAGMPILANLPIVGTLFRERQEFTTKNELIVLLTPRIWDPHGEACPSGPPPLPEPVSRGCLNAPPPPAATFNRLRAEPQSSGVSLGRPLLPARK